MRSPCPAIDCLVEIGFEPRKTRAGLEGVHYEFTNVDLEAVHLMNLSAVQVVLLSGVVSTARTFGIIETQIPPSLENPSEAAAWVSYSLRSYRCELEPLPDWFIQGERAWDILPFVASQRAYEACPKCFIDREYARPFRRKLVEELPWAAIAGDTEMTLSFDGRILGVALNGQVHEVIASGDSWPSSYRVTVSPDAPMPTRFKSSVVVVSVFEGFASMDGFRLGLCEAVE